MATSKSNNKAKTVTKSVAKTVDNVVLDAGDVEKKTEVINENLEVKTDATNFVEVVNPETHEVVKRVDWIHRHI